MGEYNSEQNEEHGLERKQKEEALQLSEARHSSMISNISDVIGIIGTDGFMKYKSPNIEKWFGWKPEDLVGTDGWLTVHPDDLERIQKEFQILLEEDCSTRTVEYKYLCKDGSYKSIELTAKNLINDPIIRGVLMNYHDITERKLAQKELKNSEQWLRTIIETTQDGFWTISLLDGKFTDVNGTYCKMSGYSKDELLKLNTSEIDAFLTPDEQLATVQKVILNGWLLFETRHKRKDGSLFDVELSVTYQNINGGVLICFCRDITQRRKAEEELSRQNSLFSTLLKNLHIGVYMIEVPSGMPLLANEASFDLLGRGILPEANSRTITKVYDLYKTGTDIPYPNEELPIVVAMNGVSKRVDDMDVMKPNRERITLEVFGSPVRNEKGNIWASLVTFQDITKRKHIEQALKESEEKFRTLHQNAGIGIGYYKLDGTVISFNHLAASHMNGVPEDFSGKSIYEIFPKEEASFYHDRIKKAAFSEKPDVYEDLVPLPSGNQYFLSTFTKICDAIDSIIGIQIISQDITEHKQTLEVIRKSEELYRSLFENMINGYAYCQMHFDENDKPYDFTYISVNSAFEKHTGLKNVIGKKVTEVIPNIRENDMELLEIYGQVSRTGTIHQSEIFVNSLQMWFNVSVYCPQMGYFVSLFEVITERKHAELKIRQQNNELVKLNVDKDLFMSILAHDLRSPFNVLLGLSDFLNENIKDFDINQIKNMVCDINKTAHNTFNLLEDILLWARIQQGKISFEPQKISLKSVFHDAVDVLRPNADIKNITIIHSVEDGLTVFADIDMLKTILRNLVSNAIKFTNNGGLINISAEKTPSGVTVSVSDNGMGLSHDNIAKLFVVGQVQTTKGTDDEKGTGLGLLLCKEFVEKHQGKIWVESEVGKGSDFKFTLPLSGEHANAIKN